MLPILLTKCRAYEKHFAIVDHLQILIAQDRPSTKVHAAPGGGSSLGYLFGDGSK